MSDEIASIRQREKFKAILRDRGVSLRRMSIDLGLNESYFQQFVAYGRPSFIEGTILQQAAAYLDLSPENLKPSASSLSESDAAEYDARGYRANYTRKNTDSPLIVLPCYKTSQKLSDNNWRQEQHQTAHMVVSRQMLEHITHTSPEHLVMLKVQSDAMAPTLAKGDCAILDCSYRLASEDGIFAILHESQLLIKRLTIDPIRKQATLSRDNANYPPIREYSLVDIKVEGRVVWVGKKL